MTAFNPESRIQFTKDPAEKYPIRCNFSKEWFHGWNAISSATVTAKKWLRSADADTENRADTTDIFQTPRYQIVNNKYVDVLFTGGTHGYDYQIRVEATIDAGSALLVRTFYIRVNTSE